MPAAKRQRMYARRNARTTNSQYFSSGQMQGTRRNPFALYSGHAVKQFFMDGSSTSGYGHNGPYYLHCSSIPLQQGTTTQARESSTVKPLEWMVRARIRWSNTSLCGACRFMLLQWSMDNQWQTPALAGITGIVNGQVGDPDWILSPQDAVDQKNGRILFDEVFMPPRATDALDNPRSMYFEVVLKAKDFAEKIQYHPNSTISGTGTLWLVLWSDRTVVNNDSPVVDVVSRIKYIDY